MIEALEKFLADKFNQMPVGVRVFTYLFVLFLFAYLLLIPRFINGELVYKFEDGSTIPYIGGDIQMAIEGRLLKFKANEGGYWSVPLVSRLPRSVSVKFHHIDADRWFGVEFKPRDYWFKSMFQVEVTDEPPGVQLSASADSDGVLSKTYVALCQVLSGEPSSAGAGMLELPAVVDSPVTDAEKVEDITKEILKSVSKATGKDASLITPDSRLTDDVKATYVQRIKIVKDLEKKFNLQIPYEHWNYLHTVFELADYVHKRKIIEEVEMGNETTTKEGIKALEQETRDWTSIQEQAPSDMRPVFKR